MGLGRHQRRRHRPDQDHRHHDHRRRRPEHPQEQGVDGRRPGGPTDDVVGESPDHQRGHGQHQEAPLEDEGRQRPVGGQVTERPPQGDDGHGQGPDEPVDADPGPRGRVVAAADEPAVGEGDAPTGDGHRRPHQRVGVEGPGPRRRPDRRAHGADPLRRAVDWREWPPPTASNASPTCCWCCWPLHAGAFAVERRLPAMVVRRRGAEGNAPRRRGPLSGLI